MTRKRFSGRLAPAPIADPGALFAMHLRWRLFSTPLEVVSVEGEEAVNELYAFTVRATVDARDDVTADRSLLFAPVEIALLPGTPSARHIHGVVTSLGAEAGGPAGRHLLRLVVRPRMWALTRRRHCRVFEDQSVIDIVTTLLREHQIVQVLLDYLDDEPVILGLLRDRVEVDPQTERRTKEAHVLVEAKQTLTLACGESAIELHENGRVSIRGKHVASISSGPQLVEGSPVRIN